MNPFLDGRQRRLVGLDVESDALELPDRLAVTVEEFPA
jgi:hypothetical protein